jgi:putative flippase GtrA
MKKLFWFAFAGGTGFSIDAGSLMLILHFTPVGPFIARILSIAIAMGATWLINRTFTFGKSSRNLASEGFRYLTVGIVSALVNYAVYSACLLIDPTLWPVLATAVGSGVAMLVSYFGYSRFVFGR